MRTVCLMLVVVCSTCTSLVVGQSEDVLLSNPVLTKAFERGCSLVVVEVLGVHEHERMFYYKVRIIQTIVAGDLSDEDVDYPLDLFAGARGGALEANSTYALFIVKECPYHINWAFRDNVISVNISNQAGLKTLAEAAQTAYAKTSISKFRQKAPPADSQPPALSEDVLALCQQFRDNPGNRAELAQKICQSDLSSRRDESKPWSSEILYSPPKMPLSRGQVLSLLDKPTLISGWTYSWLCGQPGGRGWAGRDVGILSATFDADEKAVSVLYDQQKKSRWTKFERAVNELITLGPQPEVLMLQFQRALTEHHWQQAIECCSEIVRNKAMTYSSLETFFSEYIPVDKLIQLEQFPSEGYSGTSSEIIEIHLSLDLTARQENMPPIQWNWSLVKSGDDWLIDFKLVPVATIIEKETWRRKLEQEDRQTRSAKFREYIEFRLTALSGEFVIGRPMLFRLDMINTGDSPLLFMRTSLMVNDPMTVTGPDGQNVEYIDTSYQTLVWEDVILPGETITLEDNYDVTSQYRIIVPGRYAFQFKGRPWDAKRSNVIELDVKPGVLSPMDSIYEALRHVLPEGWKITRRRVDGRFLSSNPSDEVIGVDMIGRREGKAVEMSIFLLIFLGDGQLSNKCEYAREYECWGRCKYGNVYANIHNAETLWPDHKEQIVKALEIE